MERLNRIFHRFKNKLRLHPVSHVLSDSHGAAFKKIDQKKLKYTLKFNIIQGATASGILNPHSKTGTNHKFVAYLNKWVKQKDNLIFLLGEVDCGFVIWYRAKKYSIPLDIQLQETVRKYQKFVQESSLRARNIIIVSAIPPTIVDDSVGEIVNLRREVTATQKERTRLTLHFNRAMEMFCKDFGYTFLNLDSVLIDEQTEIVRATFKNKNPLDHHLDEKLLASEIEKMLIKKGF